MERHDVLIVGAGHAGAQAAIALRQNKFSGSIAIIGDEPELPYERPPLSKDYLSGEKSFERLLIRPPAFWAEREITMLLGRRVTAVDPHARTVHAGGEAIGYSTLIWAGGGSPRRISCTGHDLRGVHIVRNRADMDRMAAELPLVRIAVVVGGGYIGLEAAAVLAKAGKRVVVLETQGRVLARVAGEPLSRFLEAEHRAQGVQIRLGAALDCILGEGQATGVRMTDGEIINCEMVIVGSGIEPSVERLLAAGAEGDNGVEVDDQCRTSIPEVFAIGDCARHANGFAGGERIRLESVQNANDQAVLVAKTICGQYARYDAVPWFWSNQYDIRLQTVGLSIRYDHAVVRGDVASRSFSVVYLQRGTVVALDCINATKDYVQGRKLVLDRATIAPEALRDASRPLKDLQTG